MKSRVLAWILAGMLAVSCLGCVTVTPQNPAAEQPAVQEAQENSAQQEAAPAEKTAEAPEERTLLTDIAELNGIPEKDLNILYGADGYATFLGNRFTEQKITDPDSALEALLTLSGLLGLDGIELEYFKTDTSPVSGMDYYSFLQVSNVVMTDSVMPAKYYSNIVKVIVDAEGNAAGVSADIDRYEVEVFDEDDILTQAEAEQYVRDWLSTQYPGLKKVDVYPQSTELIFWEDSSTNYTVGAGKLAPAWLVYTDYAGISAGNYIKWPYNVWVVYAVKNPDEQTQRGILHTFPAQSLSVMQQMNDVYTSELYFQSMRDAGTYHYTLDMTWAKEADTGYSLGDTMDVDVPVMYEEESGLYYLGDYEDRIAVSNACDFDWWATFNSLVTETPEDLSSWHFQIETEPESGRAYFCDPNYVIGSYDCLVRTFRCFKERYGFNSVDYSGLPILLLPYMLSDTGYPEAEDLFQSNASSGGQMRDWEVIYTSPMFTGCVEIGTLAHEFAHGINEAMTSNSYVNGSGAVMEAIADVIGESMAYLNGGKGEEYKWTVGSEYCSPMRDMKEPGKMHLPAYMYGAYFIKDVYTDAGQLELDNGGVHENGSVLNHLAYLFCEDAQSAEEDRLSVGELLDMWLEAVYCTTSATSYVDFGHYLVFAARHMGLPGGKADNVMRIADRYGFLGNTDELAKILEEEEHNTYGIWCDLSEANDWIPVVSMISEEGAWIGGCEPDLETGYADFVAGKEETLIPEVAVADPNGEIVDRFELNAFRTGETLYVKLYTAYAEPDDVISLEGFTIDSCYFLPEEREEPDAWEAVPDYFGQDWFAPYEAGTWTVTAVAEDGTTAIMIILAMDGQTA